MVLFEIPAIGRLAMEKSSVTPYWFLCVMYPFVVFASGDKNMTLIGKCSMTLWQYASLPWCMPPIDLS
jgi:hypothetical protein